MAFDAEHDPYWWYGQADRVLPLVDGAAYFSALRQTLARAERRAAVGAGAVLAVLAVLLLGHGRTPPSVPDHCTGMRSPTYV